MEQSNIENTEIDRNQLPENGQHIELPPLIIGKDSSQVPIRDSDVKKFRDWFCKTEEDEKLFTKLISNIRMIDEKDFDRGIEDMRRAVLDFAGDDEYYLLVDDIGKSGDLILSKLDLSEKPPIGILRPEELTTRNAKEYKKGAKLVLADDAAFSADRIRYIINDAREVLNTAPENTLVTTVGMTNIAVNKLKQEGIERVAYTFTVPVLAEILTPEETAHYKRKVEEEGIDWTGYETRVLTFSYTKVPDNFLQGFRRSQAILRDISEEGPLDITFIIDDSENGIYPPYRRSRRS